MADVVGGRKDHVVAKKCRRRMLYNGEMLNSFRSGEFYLEERKLGRARSSERDLARDLFLVPVRCFRPHVFTGTSGFKQDRKHKCATGGDGCADAEVFKKRQNPSGTGPRRNCLAM